MQYGKAGEALQLLQAAVKAHPGYLRALNDLGVLHLQFNQLEEAAATLRQAIKVNDRYQFARLNLAIVLNRQGKFLEALELLRKLQHDRVELPGLHPALAESLIGTNDLKGAKEILHTIIADRARDQAGLVEAHYKLGLLLSREENYADAVVHLQQAVSLDPQAANAYLLLGGALLQLERKAEAEPALLRAYSLGKQEMGNAQLLLGQLYTSEQKYELARDAFTQYLKDCPNAANAAQVRSAIDKIQQAIATGKPEARPK
jgi:Flp pilus assembly protein TadD